MIKLLLVEDDKNLSYIVQSGLQDIIGGYEVITAFNGKEGLQAWEEHHPDIIISDIDMPVMDGFEMVRHIRETDGDTPILFASALTSPKDVRKTLSTTIESNVVLMFGADITFSFIRRLSNEESCNRRWPGLLGRQPGRGHPHDPQCRYPVYGL